MKKRKNQIKTIEKIVKFNKNKKINFLYLKHSLLEYIFQVKINLRLFIKFPTCEVFKKYFQNKKSNTLFLKR